MALDEVDLQLLQLVFAHRHFAQRAEAGGDAIDRHGAFGNFAVEILTATHDAMAGIVAELQLVVFFDDFADALNGEVFGIDLMNLHGYVEFDLDFACKGKENYENLQDSLHNLCVFMCYLL